MKTQKSTKNILHVGTHSYFIVKPECPSTWAGLQKKCNVTEFDEDIGTCG